MQLPAFFREAPSAWFSAIESTFFLKKISDPLTKYHYAVSKLDADVAASIHELLATRANADS